MSLKKAQKQFRKTNRERAQPLERKSFGLLEKRKDYSIRARDFNMKKERLRVLAEQAALKNPDEFNFHMEKTQMKVIRSLLRVFVFVFFFNLFVFRMESLLRKTRMKLCLKLR